jgi:hypothetical protein
MRARANRGARRDRDGQTLHAVFRGVLEILSSLVRGREIPVATSSLRVSTGHETARYLFMPLGDEVRPILEGKALTNLQSVSS